MPEIYRIEYLPIAVEDLLEIFDYIKEDDPSSAGPFIDRIDEAIRKLECFPYLGSIPKDDKLERSGHRVLIIDNYLVFYLVRKNIVEIRRIIHGRRRYSFLF